MNEQEQNNEAPTRVECPASKDPAVRLFIVAGMLIVAGVYCFVDHFIMGKYQYPDPYELNAYLKYLFNHYGVFVFLPPGVIALIWGIILLRRKLLADEDGIGYAGKEKIPWAAVRSLDSSDLADKGILRLRYEADGQEMTLKLDKWKLQNFRSLVLLLEKKVPSGS